MKIDKTISHRRFLFIRKLIGLAFTYGHNSELFHKKFLDAVNIKTLKQRQVIDPIDCDFKRGVISISYLKDKGLTDKEVEIYCLTELGFTAQELCVMYKLKNTNSVYVKRYRIKKKLQAYCQPEVLVSAVVFILFLLIILFLFG